MSIVIEQAGTSIFARSSMLAQLRNVWDKDSLKFKAHASVLDRLRNLIIVGFDRQLITRIGETMISRARNYHLSNSRAAIGYMLGMFPLLPEA
jgi:hypothetical protein